MHRIGRIDGSLRVPLLFLQGTVEILHPNRLGQLTFQSIVDFPAGYTPPTRGATVTRDEARPYEITEVRKQSDGQLNVFVREIMQ